MAAVRISPALLSSFVLSDTLEFPVYVDAEGRLDFVLFVSVVKRKGLAKGIING